jgi:flagellar biosynthesis/type III secretory pathway chaperone
MNAPDPGADLLHGAKQLLRELQDEASALTAGDYEDLAGFAQRKSALVQELERSSANSLWDGLAPIVRAAVDAVLRQCRRQNLANAALLEARHQQIRWALAHLGLSRGTFYNATGAAVTNFATRSVGAA